MNDWNGKRVLVTGVCGTVGAELLRQLTSQGPTEIIGIDNNETELFFTAQAYASNPKVRVYLADIRDPMQLGRFMEGVDVVLHAAAYKHVFLCEQAPRNAVQTNVLGTQNVIDAALANRVERVIFTSSDKAVNPTSVMGTSKLMGERLMTAANALTRDGRPVFASTRFGNVLGSRGSVIPLFRRQVAAGGPVTLTDERMTRFIMTLEEACRLVMESVFLARGGEVFVTKMPVVRIADLARVMVEALAPRHRLRPEDVHIEVVGAKAGEKMYEELMNEEEVRRTIELDRYFVVTPALKSVLHQVVYAYEGASAESVKRPYHSANETPLDQRELAAYLSSNGLLDCE